MIRPGLRRRLVLSHLLLAMAAGSLMVVVAIWALPRQADWSPAQLLLIGLVSLLPPALLVLLVSVRVVAGIAGPLEEVTGTARRLAAGDLEARAPLGPRDELGVLATTLNAMAESLRHHLDEAGAGRRRLEAVVEAMGSGMLLLDAAGRVTLANPAAAAFLGVKTSELSGRNHWEVIREYELAAMVDDVLRHRHAVRREVKLALPKALTLEVSITPLPEMVADPGGVLILMYDLTDLRRLERLRSDFVANISHELKTPVTAVQGFAETLLNAEGTSPEDVREFAAIIHREASRLARLIDDLLELSRIESGAVKPVMEPVDLTEVALLVVERHRPAAEAAGMVLEGPAAGPVLVRGDAHQLEQMMSNLVDNAIKYGRAGGRVAVSVTREGSEAMVAVADDGPGIAVHDVPRVFERFYRGDKSRSPRHPGTGLGLAIVRHVAGVHGGTVGLSSRPGHTVFTVRLPSQQ
ncbi:MAG TPA: ATP-binding protein [Bacillota bacterium]|nr:ATP-binding protein [Bacillota bacterium]